MVAALFAAVWGIVDWLDIAPDETTRWRDDAFYEFSWAANVAAGRGAEVSDGVTTSGVQWLWTWLLVPIVWLVGPAALPAVASWLGVTLHVVTAGIWYRLARDPIAGVCLSLCWLGHPLLLREAQNGQETALAVLFATLVFGLRKARERWFLPVAALAVFARSDLLALVVLLSLSRHRRALPRALPTILLACALPPLVHRAFGGGFLQDSAMPMTWLFHENLTAIEGVGFWAQQWWFTRPVLLGGPYATASAFGFGFTAFLLLRPLWPAALRAVPAVAVGCAAALGVSDLFVPAWCALLLVLYPSIGHQRMSCERLAVVFGLVAIVVLHWAVRWYPRDYYLAPLVVVAFAALGRFGRFRALLLVFAVVQVFDSARIRPEPLAGQREMQLAGRFLHQVLPAGLRVGCFNSGLVTYHADVLAAGGVRRGIVNLDGVVDHRAFAALREGRLAAWLDAQDVHYLLDNPAQFSLDPSVPHACGRFFAPDFDPRRDLQEVARFDVPGVGGRHGDSMRLYRRLRSAQPAPQPLAVAEGVLAYEPDGSAVVAWHAAAGQRLELDLGPTPGVRSTLVVAEVDTVVICTVPAGLTRRLLIDGEPWLELQ